MLADYKRMVSYMYQYENGVKKKNVGYARIEAKNGQCKITLHMQLLGQIDSIFPTYLIQRDEKGLELIYLGDTILKNQVMDSKLNAEENNIMNTGHRLSEMGGLLLFMHDNIFFATEWDDKIIDASEVLDALKPKKQAKQKEEEEEAEEEEVELAAAIIPATIIEPEKSEKLSPEGLSLVEEINIPKYKLPRGWKTIERMQKPKVAEVAVEVYQQRENQTQENQQQDNQFQEKADESMKTAAIQEETVIAEQEQSELEQSLEETRFYVEDQPMEEGNSNETNDSPEKDSAEEDLMEQPEDLVAKKLFDSYPRIYPFEDNEIILCVKIEPKDIGMLPKDLWALSNNSFLMHGFYCYHHLIFAKMKDKYGSRFILGIPGIYHNRERFMARMFGFESFKSIRRRELQQGDFGYWYLEVNF